MAADKIGALAHGLTRKLHRLVVVAADELRVSGDAVVDRQKRIARAQSSPRIRTAIPAARPDLVADVPPL